VTKKLISVAIFASGLALSAQTLRASERSPQLKFSVDPYLSIETGIDFTFSSVSSVARGEEWAFRPLEGQSSTGIPARAARTILFDIPVSFWFAILQHEAFGHSGRAREFGSSAGAHMGSPWEFSRNSYANFSTDGLSNDDLLRVYAGGVEANGWTATTLERQMVAGRKMRSLDLLFLAWNRYATSAYVLRTTPDPEEDPLGFWREWTGGGDAAKYLGHLNTRFYGVSGITPTGSSDTVITEWNRLERQAYWNLLDPGFWLSLWTVGRHVAIGDQAASVPLPTIHGRRFLPVLSADWSPDGGTISLEAVFGPKTSQPNPDGPQWFSFVMRHGNGPAGPFGAIGAGTEKLWQTTALRIGGEAETWSRGNGGLGGGVRARMLVRGGPLGGVFFGVGLKSAGHWPGRPAGVGPFIRIGYEIGL